MQFRDGISKALCGTKLTLTYDGNQIVGMYFNKEGLTLNLGSFLFKATGNEKKYWKVGLKKSKNLDFAINAFLNLFQLHTQLIQDPARKTPIEYSYMKSISNTGTFKIAVTKIPDVTPFHIFHKQYMNLRNKVRVTKSPILSEKNT